MKAQVERKALADAAKAVSKFLPRLMFEHPAGRILVEAKDGSLGVYATDLQAGRRIEVEASIADEGRIVVDPRLAGVTAGATGEELTLSATDQNLTVSGEHASWRLGLGNVEDYPEISELGSDPAKVPIEHWSRIQAVATCAGGASSPRPELQGVRIEEGTAAATDSYRLAYTSISEVDHPGVTIPAHAIAALNADVSALEVGERIVRADLDDGYWWTRVIDGNYVKWRTLVDKYDPQVKVEVVSDVLADAISRSLLVGESHIPVYLEPSDGGLRLFRTYQSEIAYDETIEAKIDGSNDVKVAFNPSYIRSLVAPVESVTIELVDEFKPAEFTGDDWFHGVLMPVRV